VTAVKIEGLRKSFGKVEVLRGIDLDVAEHEASVPRRARPRQQPPTFERKDQPD